jgi:hypothetical protein
MANRTEYQIKLKSGLYVGLVNFGRTYKACKKACRLMGISEDMAKRIARDWDGELTKFELLPCVMSNYGEGWDVECFCKDYDEAKADLQAYRENCRDAAFQIKWKWSERYISLKAA